MKYRNDMGKEKDFSRKSDLSQLSDDEILQGFKDADARIVREYYYGYCRCLRFRIYSGKRTSDSKYFSDMCFSKYFCG